MSYVLVGDTAQSVGTGLAPVRKMVAYLYRRGHNVPLTRFRTGASPVPTLFEWREF